MTKQVMLIIAAGVLCACAAAEPLPAAAQWQEESAGPRFRMLLKSTISRGSLQIDETRSGGLCLQILDWADQWPKIVADWRDCRESSQWIRGGFGKGAGVDILGTTFTLMDLGTVSTGPAGTQSELADITQDWTTVELVYEVPSDGIPKEAADMPEYSLLDPGDLRLSVRVSRLSPALLFHTASPVLRFFGKQPKPQRFPEFYLARGMSQAGSLAMSGGAEMTAEGAVFPLDSPQWVLCWGADLRPLLFVFEHAPESMFSAQGVAAGFRFEDEAGHVALMPILGDRNIAPTELDKWRQTGIPAEIQDACEAWSGFLRNYPVKASESWRYDKANDAVIVAGRIEFVSFDGAGAPEAPLPPAVALAVESGFPVEINRPYKKTGLTTAFGPLWLCKGDRYEYLIRGLGKYMAERRRINPGKGDEPEFVRKRLLREVEKTVQAGHLAPVRFVSRANHGISGVPPRLTWANPAENLALMLNLLPALPAETGAGALGYISKEREQYPPEAVPLLGFYEGARREIHPIENNRAWQKDVDSTSVDDMMKKESFYLLNNLMPLLGLYALAEHNLASGNEKPDVTMAQARSMIEPWLRHSDWATGGFMRWERAEFGASTSENNMRCTRTDLWDGMGGVIDANAFLAGAIGYARLARMASDDEAAAEAAYLFAKAAVFRFFLGKYNEYCWRNNLPRAGERYGDGQQGNFFRPISTPLEQDPNLVHEFSQFGPGFASDVSQIGLLSNYVYLTPETGRFLKDWLFAECEANEQRLENTFWYAASTTSESDRPHPEIAQYLFMGKAWVTGAKPEDMAIYCDSPAVARGDLYYMSRLAETLKAYRGWDWE